jgi:hypothetical protein
MKLTMITAAVCLALTALPAHGKQSRRACIREMLKTFVTDTAQAKRMCDPKNAVKPNEFGWVCPS